MTTTFTNARTFIYRNADTGEIYDSGFVGVEIYQ